MARVYISSTFEDLIQYRVAAAEACRSLGHVAVEAEDFGGGAEPPVEKALAEVASADIYLGIVAWQYGLIPPGRRHFENLSITQLEYREARDKGKPCLIFMIGEDTNWPPELIDSDFEKLIQFRRELQDSNPVTYFDSIEDFRAKLVKALAALEPRSEQSPTPAWFDAFLSYPSSERKTVQLIAQKLISNGVRVWMDVRSLRPGDKWEESRNDALSRAATIIVFLGSEGTGPGQRTEFDQVMRRQAWDAAFCVIPVLLPGTNPQAVPSDLRRFRWIAFPSLDDPVAYTSLLRAIRRGDYPAPSQPKEVSLSDADLELITDVLFRVVSRLRERPEMLSSLDGPTFWAQARKIAPQISTFEDLRKLKEELSTVQGPGPLWSAWIRNTRASELAALMRNASPVEAKVS